jgi:hypothetical protein
MIRATASPAVQKALKWSRRAGLLGILFFVVKGLIWTVVLVIAWRLR